MLVSGLSSKGVIVHTEDHSIPCCRISHDIISSSSEVSAASVSVPQTLPCVGEILQSSNLKSFSLTELQNATRNFRVDSLLGDGDIGSVFKGWIDEHSSSAAKPGTGIAVAVKRLNQDGFKGHNEFMVCLTLITKKKKIV